jgi:glutathione S-transferase
MLQLVYFAVRARAETARMILEFGKVPYLDRSVPEYFGGSRWPAVKSAGLTAFGQLPVLDIDGTQLSQEAAINRYCAGLVPGLIPADPVQAALADSIYMAAEELAVSNREYSCAFYSTCVTHPR